MATMTYEVRIAFENLRRGTRFTAEPSPRLLALQASGYLSVIKIQPLNVDTATEHMEAVRAAAAVEDLDTVTEEAKPVVAAKVRARQSRRATEE